MMRLLIVILFVVVAVTSVGAAGYGVARGPTPVLNSADFPAVFGGQSGVHLKTDRCGQVRELEYMALPGTVFKLVNTIHRGDSTVYGVETDEYPAPRDVRLYVDSRFLDLVAVLPKPRTRVLPPRDNVVAALRGATGNPYVWGGNVRSGIPEMEKLYRGEIRGGRFGLLTLAGLDCSGPLYFATGGWTPRNTSQLITYGQGVDVAGKGVAAIVPLLQPLDLIVWYGHVIIVLDRDTAIESRLACGKPGNGGVVVTPLSQRLTEVMVTRRPVNNVAAERHHDTFVVRRWYGER